MVGKVELDSTFPIIDPDRGPQIAADAGDRCFHTSAMWRRPTGNRDADHMETRL